MWRIKSVSTVIVPALVSILSQNCVMDVEMAKTPTPLRDIVVILPGITGSVLQKDGQDVWNFSAQSLSQLIKTFGASVSQLRMDGDDPGTEDLGDGIKATSLVQGAHIIPRLEKVLGGYHFTAQAIANEFQAIKGSIFNEEPANFGVA